MGITILIGLLSGLLIFTVVMISMEIHKYFEPDPEVDEDEPLTEKTKESFINITPEFHIDAGNIETKNQLTAMKYKLEMFKLRNEFYK
ncbi:hypothetical protein [Ulvibacterium marinum]|uniref:Uncharacterized protein n=1 Tax=Ulvibacterium marinum TaxID=2419782 RepID=A0A3B0C038_9FLAO|nr:hypothetical protein [Ulvibacterium marinum]RKN78720.1 hypothetical protein D7Z94_21235 [Ulvibacterium marinum]